MDAEGCVVAITKIMIPPGRGFKPQPASIRGALAPGAVGVGLELERLGGADDPARLPGPPTVGGDDGWGSRGEAPQWAMGVGLVGAAREVWLGEFRHFRWRTRRDS